MFSRIIIVIALLACGMEVALLLRPRPLPAPMAPRVAKLPAAPVVTEAEENPPLPGPVATAGEPPPEPAEQPAADAQATPQNAAAEMLRLMKAGNFAEFLTKFMPPSAAAQMTDERKAALLERYKDFDITGSPENAQWQASILALESLQAATPTLNEAGDRATFDTSEVTMPDGTPLRGVPKTLVFQQENGVWYLR
jgi:hypothetical protein